jgi:hypothetical protein
MRSILFLVMVFGIGAPLVAQQVKLPELIDMLDWTDKRIDTTLKKKGYLLMQKDVDSTSTLFQYSNLERKKDGPAIIRSIIYMKAAVADMRGRLITYRTYDKNEFGEISSYLLANNYSKTHEFDFDEAKHTLYSNGKQEIRLKVITAESKNKRKFTSYEVELGK